MRPNRESLIGADTERATGATGPADVRRGIAVGAVPFDVRLGEVNAAVLGWSARSAAQGCRRVVMAGPRVRRTSKFAVGADGRGDQPPGEHVHGA